MKSKTKIFLLGAATLIFSSVSHATTCEEQRINQFKQYRDQCAAQNQTDPNTPPTWWTTCALSYEPYANQYGVTGILAWFNGTLYSAGQTYFSKSGGYLITDCAGGTSRPTKGANQIRWSNHLCGSDVQVENQSFSETIPIVGGDFDLVYYSGYAKGRVGDYKLHIDITGNTLRDQITSFDVEVYRGATLLYSNNYLNTTTNQTYDYVWDGLDLSSQVQLGREKFTVKVTEISPTANFAVSTDLYLGNFNAKTLGLGGWLPSIIHFYDVNSKTLYSANGGSRSVSVKPWNTTGYFVSEDDGSLVYYFDASGRQIYTKTGLTGQTLYTFNYNGSGELTSVAGPFSRTTTFDRNLSGVLQSITAPKGQVTGISLDLNGYISDVTNPNSETYSITYDGSEGLLETFTKPGGQVSTFTYDLNANLTRDEKSSGYFFDLEKLFAYQIDYKSTTRMSRVTKYQGYSNGSNVNVKKIRPNNSQEILDYSETNKTVSFSKDGITSGYTYVADPRFGGMANFKSTTSFSSGSVSKSFTHTPTITLSNANDPFSIATYSIQSTSGSYQVTSSYSPSTKTFSSATSLGRTGESIIDSYERLASQKRGNLYPIEYTYTGEQLTKVNQNTRETNLTYNSTTGFLSSITNSLTQVTAFTYDSAGRIYSKILPDLRSIIYSYDSNGNVTGITPPGRTIHSFGLNADENPSSYDPPTLTGVPTVNTTYTYNNDKQLTQITKPTGQTIQYTYNSTTGALQTLTTSAGNYNVYYYSSGLVSNVYPPSGLNLTLGYSGGIVTSNSITGAAYSDYTKSLNTNGTVAWDMTSSYGGSTMISYAYDNDELLTTAGSLTLTNDTPNGMLTATSIGTSPNIVTDAYTYNSFGEVTGYQAKYGTTVIYDLTLGRDGMGRINSKTQAMNSVTDTYGYTFDTTGRLTQTDKNSTTVATYGYDDNSNRNSGTIGSQATTATYDAQDRMTAYNLLSFTYNANGDLTSRTNTLTSTTTNYVYDVFGNLTSVTLPSTTVITYEIDGLNRRIGKKVSGTLQKRWVYMDQTRIAAELDSSGNITKRFVYASKSNIPDYMIMGGNNYRIISDHLGSPRLVVKVSDGSVAGLMDHDEYGRVLADTNPGLLPFGFAGGLYDADTGLVRFGARDYDTETGRWTSKDPILFNGGDTNLFGYVQNDPVNFIDPEGKFPLPLILGALAGIFYATDTDTPGAAQDEMIGVPMAVAGGWMAGGGVCKATDTSIQYRSYPNSGGGGVGIYRNNPLPGQKANIIRADVHPITKGGPSVPHIDIPGVVKHWPWR